MISRLKTNIRRVKLSVLILTVLMLPILSSCSASNTGDTKGKDKNKVSFAGLWDNECFLVPDRENPAIGLSPLHLHCFDALKVGEEYYFYHISTDQHGKPAIGLVVTKDGINFVDKGLVLETNPDKYSYDYSFASFPGIFYESGTFYLYYEGSGSFGSSICLATSTDGIKFTKYQDNPILTGAESYDVFGLGTPQLIKKENTYYLIYHGYDGTDMAISVATSNSPFGPFERYSGNPVIPNGGKGTYDSGTTGKRGIYKEGEYYYMFYEASTDGSTGPEGAHFNEATWTSGFARSKDLLTWEKYHQNPVLFEHKGFGNDAASLIEINGTVWAYNRIEGNVSKRSKLANEATGGLQISWQQKDLKHETGKEDKDGWSAKPGNDKEGWLFNGASSKEIPKGENIAVFKFRTDEIKAGDTTPMVRIEVYQPGNDTVLASREVTANQFKKAKHDEYFVLPFKNEKDGEDLELRVWWYGKASIKSSTAGVAVCGKVGDVTTDAAAEESTPAEPSELLTSSDKPREAVGIKSSSCSTENVVKLTITNMPSKGDNKYCYYTLQSNIGFKIQSGDTLEYDVLITEDVDGAGGLEVACKEDQDYLRDQGDWLDADQLRGHPAEDISDLAYKKWHHRVLKFPESRAGSTINHIDVVGENDTENANYTAYYNNIVIKRDGKVVYTLYESKTDLSELTK